MSDKMNKRLQFRHHGVGSGYTVADGVFESREDAIEYIYHAIRHDGEGGSDGADNTLSLYAEPTVLRYKNEEHEDDPHVLLAIGSMTNQTIFSRDNRFCIIDTHKTETEIEEISEELEKAVSSLTIITSESSTLGLSASKTADGTVLSGDVKVPQSHLFDGERTYKDNKIISTDNGIFVYVDLEYDNSNDKIKFTINDVEKEMSLDIDYPINGYYSTRDESIHLGMKHGGEIVINLNDLIAEWVVEGDAAASPIVLTKEEVHYDSDATMHVEPWQDVLRADVRIDNDRVNNILEKSSDNRYLYVDGIASNIVYYKNGTKTNVKETLDELTQIKLSTDSSNILMQKVDGFFASSKLEYVSNENTIVFTTSSIDGTNKETRIHLNTFKLFENIVYDPATESLVITYVDGNGKVQVETIPIGEMLRDWEWEVNNYGHNVHLQKDRSVQGSDQLSADVIISENSDNILKDVDHSLYVKGTADNIKYGANSNVKGEIDALKISDSTLDTKIDAETNRATLAENVLQTEINALSSDTESRIKTISSNDHSINVSSLTSESVDIKVNLSHEVEDGKANIIKLNNDGLYAGVDLEYYFDSGTSKNMLVFKTTNGTKTFDLKTNSVVDNIYYDAATEEIVIEYTVNGKRMPDVRIPIRNMIEEIDVQSTPSLELIKIKNTTAGPDIIKGNVLVNTVHSDNIIINDGGLYVSGSQIEANTNAIAALNTRVANEENRAATRENAIASDLASEVTRATNAENAISTSLSNEVIRSISAETVINNEIANLDDKIDAEKSRAQIAETANANAINNEAVRATSAETALQNSIQAEVTRATNAETANANAISAETTRATNAETANANAISTETTRATNAETANANAISAETTRATNAETALQNAIAAVSGSVDDANDDIATVSGDLKTLSERVDEIASGGGGDVSSLSAKTVTSVDDTDSIDLTISNATDGTKKVSADLKVSASGSSASNNENIVKVLSDGVYASVDYNTAENALYVNGVKKVLNAGSFDFKTSDANHNVSLTSIRDVSGSTIVQGDVSVFDCGEYE